MTLVTVVRHIPAPIIGMIGVVHDRTFETLEANLDRLDTTGMVVERFDPATARTKSPRTQSYSGY